MRGKRPLGGRIGDRMDVSTTRTGSREEEQALAQPRAGFWICFRYFSVLVWFVESVSVSICMFQVFLEQLE